VLGVDAGGVNDPRDASAVKKLDGLDSVKFKFLGLGGELGGSIVTIGEYCWVDVGTMESGLGRIPLAEGAKAEAPVEGGLCCLKCAAFTTFMFCPPVWLACIFRLGDSDLGAGVATFVDLLFICSK
jgi:hypothetical protein